MAEKKATAIDEGAGGRVEDAPARVPMMFEPGSMDEAFRFADFISKSGLIPAPLVGKPSDVLIVYMKGRELGLKPMQAFGTIAVVNGKAVCEAQLLVALVKASPRCEYFNLIESSDKSCTYESKRDTDPKPSRITFTIEQATRAGLLNKDNWKNYPAAMLRARASSHLCKAEWQDVILGITTRQEVEDAIELDPITGEVLNAPEPRAPAKLVQLTQAQRLEKALEPTAPAPAKTEQPAAAVTPLAPPKPGEKPASMLSQLAAGRRLDTLDPDEMALGLMECEEALKKNPRSADVLARKKQLTEEQNRRFAPEAKAREPGEDD